MHPNLLSLMLFCFVTSCTPGPNNILASYSSFNFGIKKTFPHMLGVALGYTSMITILDVGLIVPFKKYPIILGHEISGSIWQVGKKSKNIKICENLKIRFVSFGASYFPDSGSTSKGF